VFPQLRKAQVFILSSQQIWTQYLPKYGLDAHEVRPGCEPRQYLHAQPPANAIVLVHGLTDSPFYMGAVGEYFHTQMGFNVYLPLLAAHGLRDPLGMRAASLAQWIAQVDFALRCAQEDAPGALVSIGGLSLGGALSLHRALYSQQITGGLFLFSPAIRIAYPGLLRSLLYRFLAAAGPLNRRMAQREDRLPLIGQNPYRYARRDLHGSLQLFSLLRALNAKLREAQVAQPTFVVLSEADQSIDLRGGAFLLRRSPRSELFRIGLDFHVPHASPVLAQDVLAENGSPLEPKNPFFAEMLLAAHRFARQHLPPAP
jgi:esterase/lipase